MPLIDFGAMFRGILGLIFKFYTPKGFWNPNEERREWVKELDIDQEEDTLRLVVECKASEFAMWMLLNGRPAMDEFLDLEDGRDLLYEDKIPDAPQ